MQCKAQSALLYRPQQALCDAAMRPKRGSSFGLRQTLGYPGLLACFLPLLSPFGLVRLLRYPLFTVFPRNKFRL
jgi:hypothetical protein